MNLQCTKILWWKQCPYSIRQYSLGPRVKGDQPCFDGGHHSLTPVVRAIPLRPSLTTDGPETALSVTTMYLGRWPGLGQPRSGCRGRRCTWDYSRVGSWRLIVIGDNLQRGPDNSGFPLEVASHWKWLPIGSGFRLYESRALYLCINWIFTCCQSVFFA